MALIQVTAPTTEPLTVAEVKEHLNITISNDDDLIAAYIRVARKQAENKMKRQINPATWKLVFDDFANSTAIIELPRPPLSTATSNVSIVYYNSSATTTLSSTAYKVDYENEPYGRVFPTYGNSWPSDVLDQHGSVSITYRSGYPTQADVPQSIKQWIMIRVGQMYEQREAVTPDKYMDVGRDFVDGLLDPYLTTSF